MNQTINRPKGIKSCAVAVAYGLVLWLGIAVAALAQNNAAFVSQSVPTTMDPYQTYAVSVTMQNTGTTTWTTASNYSLSSQNPTSNMTWGMSRVALPNSVAPGASVTFAFNVTAPKTAGTYNFQWRMVQDGVAFFGAFTTNVVVTVNQRNAAFVSQSVPTIMALGQTYAVSVTMQNTGTSTWTAGTYYSLGSQNPQGNTRWGMSRVALPNSVAPGASVTFAFNVTAPTTSGTYNFQWQMVQDYVAWFGALTTNVQVMVGDVNNAQFVSQNVPTSMIVGQTYSVSVTMQNTGSTTWTAASNYRLGSQNPQDNTRWGMNRVNLPNSVAPGASVTFAFNVTAPTTAGTYNFQWKMLREGVAWFGALTTNVAVTVALGNVAQFVSQSVPASMVANQAYPVSVTMQNTGDTTWTAGAYYLASENPPDNMSWGLNRVELPGNVAPGQNVTFAFNVTPTIGGVFNFQWRMAQNGTRFGASSTNVAVSVSGTNDAAFVSQSVPTTMTPGQSYPVSVTLQNTGNTTWSAGNNFRLGSQNPPDNTIWGVSRVELPGAVAPGATVTVSFNATAPSAAGLYNFQWRMIQEGVGWFGASTPNVSVSVGQLNATLYFIHPDHLNSPRSISDAQGRTVWSWANDDPFGNNAPNENPSGLGTFTCNLRLPGQYFDKETNTHYNYFRDYDPAIGRYVQSDPIGLAGGINTYGYVGGNPLSRIDPLGLDTVVIVIYDRGVGSHAAVRIDNSGDPILFDPAGSYCRPKTENKDQCEPRGSGDAFFGRDANLQNFTDFHRGLGSNVRTLRFLTTPAQEAQIAGRINDLGGALPLYCARSVSDALSGIGPFQGLPSYWWPGNLYNDLRQRGGR